MVTSAKAGAQNGEIFLILSVTVFFDGSGFWPAPE